jgi:hypothetical protein
MLKYAIIQREMRIRVCVFGYELSHTRLRTFEAESLRCYSESQISSTNLIFWDIFVFNAASTSHRELNQAGFYFACCASLSSASLLLCLRRVALCFMRCAQTAETGSYVGRVEWRRVEPAVLQQLVKGFVRSLRGRPLALLDSPLPTVRTYVRGGLTLSLCSFYSYRPVYSAVSCSPANTEVTKAPFLNS